MSAEWVLWLGVAIFAIAVLYSSVGHAGASGYLAVMALFGLAPEVMKPTALVLNILVATLATIKFYRAGCFTWRLFWPMSRPTRLLAWSIGCWLRHGMGSGGDGTGWMWLAMPTQKTAC